MNLSFAELPEEVRERWDGFVAGALLDVNKRNTVESVKKIKLIFLYRHPSIAKYDLSVVLYNQCFLIIPLD